MKIKEIIKENAPNTVSSTVTGIAGDKITVRLPDGSTSIVTASDVKPGNNGTLVAQVPQAKPQLGNKIDLVPVQQNTTQPPTNQTNVGSGITEVNDDIDPSSATDNELIKLAKENGIYDQLNFDDEGNLTNREEIVELLSTGADIGGDQTDDFIQDVEDQEYGQVIERVRKLSGISSK